MIITTNLDELDYVRGGEEPYEWTSDRIQEACVQLVDTVGVQLKREFIVEYEEPFESVLDRFHDTVTELVREYLEKRLK